MLFIHSFLQFPSAGGTTYALDNLSTGAKSAATGLFGCYRLLTSYTGAIFNIRRSSDSVTSDFYADSSGNLWTGAGGTGTTISSWLAGATAFVAKWYDQSGNNRFAYQNTAGTQPSLTLSTNAASFVNFSTNANAWLSITAGVVPALTYYTVSIKHGTITNTGGNILWGGTAANSLANSFRRQTTNYSNWWYNQDLNSMGTYADNEVVTFRLGGATAALSSALTGAITGSAAGTMTEWLFNGNGTKPLANTYSGNRGGGTWSYTSGSGSECIGCWNNGSDPFNGQLMWISVFNIALTDTDRGIVESVT